MHCFDRCYDRQLNKLEEQIASDEWLFASIEQRKTCECFSGQGYRTFGSNDENQILMSYKNSAGDRTEIVIYPDGKWDEIN